MGIPFLALIIILNGCATSAPSLNPNHPGAWRNADSTPPVSQKLLPTATTPPPVTPRATNTDPPSSPFPLEPAATRLLNQLIPHLNQTTHPTRISLHGITNQSHSSREEFEQFIQRIATILTRTGKTNAITFTSHDSPDTAYEFRGSAYLITAHGFDQWELHLRLFSSSPDETTTNWPLWESPYPIRILRHARPGEPQFLPIN